ncbi:unnamed protein product, partial [Owenia fusiformis]
VLMIAVEKKHMDCFHALVDHGADVNATDVEGKTVLSLISGFANRDCIEIYCILKLNDAKDNNFERLMSLNKNASTDQQNVASQQLDESNSRSKLSLKHRARHSIHLTRITSKSGYKHIIKDLIDNGHLPYSMNSFMLFEDDIREMMEVLTELHGRHAEATEAKAVLERQYEKEVQLAKKFRGRSIEEHFLSEELLQREKEHEKKVQLAETRRERSLEEQIPFEELLPRAKKLLRRIPEVKFYGMREDGFYTIHVVDGQIDKTERFIKKHIPGYRFNFVPWRREERIQLLGCTGAPLHIREKDDPTSEFITKPYGTLGGLASNAVNENVYALTASHVVTAKRNPLLKQDFITWLKDDQSDIRSIGREVPYQIPLRLDPDDPLDGIDISCDDDIVYDDDEGEDDPQFDIALIQISDQHQDIKQQC